MPQKNTFRQRLAGFIAGSSTKDFIPALNPVDGVTMPGSLFGGRLNGYSNKTDQIQALTGWVFAANSAIADPTAAVELKLYRKKKDGDREEVTSGPALEILDLLNRPNAVHTGKQLRQLHFTYMNIVGESYIYMRDKSGDYFVPSRGKLPAALDIFPAHLVQFKLGESYSKSIVKYNNYEYPSAAFIRDLNPDPMNPYMGRSIVAAAAAIIDTEDQMKAWNQNLFANNARPSLIFSSNEPLSDEAYQRWKEQFQDDHTGTANAYKPLLIEGGKATPWMMSQQDLDFLASRKFSRDEILAMFRLQPGMIGIVENVNRASFESGFYANAVNNVVPRISQFVEQINATLVSVYDPSLEVDYVNPVPEDIEAKLRAAEAGVNKWWTIDEVRDMYGEDPLPDGLGEHIIIQGKGAPMSLEDVLADDVSTPDTDPQDPEDPDADGDDDLTEAPTDESKSYTRRSEKQISARDYPDLYDGTGVDPNDLGCIMLDTETLSILKHVPDGNDDLVEATTRHDHTMGAVAEKEAHVTLLYGLLENGNVWKDKVDTLLDDWKPADVTINKVGSFDLGDSYAIVGHVKKTPQLVDGHERLTLLPHIQTFSEYKPHLTLAYVKHDAGTADKWVKALGDVYNGKTIKAKGINYGDEPETESKSLGGEQRTKKA